jgi:hypothetical protein
VTQSVWSTQTVSDISGHYGFDITAELEKALVEELSKSIDKQIVDDMLFGVPLNERLNKIIEEIENEENDRLC